MPRVLTRKPTLTVRPLAAYFIMNNRIYQSPDLYTVLSNRLVSMCALPRIVSYLTLV